MVATTAAFRTWLKSVPNMKLSSDASVARVTHEGITNYDSLKDFDNAAIKNLPKVCRETINAIPADAANNIQAEPVVPGANVSSISAQRLIVAANATRYYDSIGRTIDASNMHYNNVLSNFKIEWEAHEALQKEDDPSIPKINDRDNDRKIIRWAPIFLDCMDSTFGAKGPLRYVLRDKVVVPPEAADPLEAYVPATGNNLSVPGAYFGTSRSLMEELVARLPHTGPIYRNDNATVYQKIEEAARGTSCESTIKVFSRRKDGRGAFQALIANHAGDVKYRAIAKKRQNLLQNIKWTGNSYPLESHVSNHRQAYDDLNECAGHITTNVPSEPQRVEFLIDSITSKDTTLQATIGLVRANTNNMRNDFELAASTLIEVDPFHRATRTNTRNANISAIDFSAGRGTTGVDLRFYPHEKFKALPKDQQDKLKQWMYTKEGRKSKQDFFKNKKSRDDDDKGNKKKRTADQKENWRSKFKKAMKTDKELKTVMSILAEEEKTNQALVAALQGATLPPEPTTANPIKPTFQNTTTGTISSSLATKLPATSIRLQSILRK